MFRININVLKLIITRKKYARENYFLSLNTFQESFYCG